MKKLLILAFGLALLLGFSGVASAGLFTNTQTLNKTLGDAWWNPSESASWTHSLPGDFQVPHDVVYSAILHIDADFVTGGNDSVEVAGAFQGYLNTETGWIWNSNYLANSVTYFNVSSAFSSWSTGEVLNVTVNAFELGGPLNYLVLNTATLTLNYENGTAPAPVPEPATMLLLGTGLFGLAGASRKKLLKK